LKVLHLGKKPVQEELDFLFASQTSNVVTSAASNVLTKLDWRVKKGNKNSSTNLLAKSEEEGEQDSIIGPDDQKMNPDEALGHALLKLTNVMVREQNFLMDYFAVVKSSQPVVSTISSVPPILGEENMDVSQWQAWLSQPRQPFKDPKAEKRIQ
jgi:hypothetical protein